MVVVMEERASEEQVQHVIAQLVEKGFDVHRSTGQLRSVLGAVGRNRSFDTRLIEVMDGVHEVLRITEPYKLASRTFKPERSTVSFDEFRVGGDEVIVMAGPCSVETEEQIAASAAAVKKAGAQGVARRRLQAAELSLQLPGPGRRGAASDACGRRCRGAEGRLRGHGRQPDRTGRALRGHLAGRRPQHAELHVAARAGQDAHARAPQAGDCGDHRGVAPVGGVRALGGQHGCHPVRTGHPDLRELYS